MHQSPDSTLPVRLRAGSCVIAVAGVRYSYADPAQVLCAMWAYRHGDRAVPGGRQWRA